MNSSHRHTGLTFVPSSNMSVIPDLTPLRYTNLRPLNDVAQESNRFEHICTVQLLFPTDIATSIDLTTQLLPTSVKADIATRLRTTFTIATLKRLGIATQIQMTRSHTFRSYLSRSHKLRDYKSSSEIRTYEIGRSA
ncbi:hypothetical protein F511_26944 [Dorcoceras hygrometricum]|uniref:Uncharacterized protein n=1 Tax=Dorcoceras hygrometricum TaxID=472368 RepID=A0A2Z7BP24_9LAMI|nr:hypothetical protein F511_26944 [Dorcoceras hygrometricum]